MPVCVCVCVHARKMENFYTLIEVAQRLCKGKLQNGARYGRQDCVVSIATRYGLDGPGIES
jgi:hypothetical protein